MTHPNDVTGIVASEELTVDRSSWVDLTAFTRGNAASLPPAEARQFGAAIGWKVFDPRPVASLLRADDVTHTADTTGLTADYF